MEKEGIIIALAVKECDQHTACKWFNKNDNT